MKKHLFFKSSFFMLTDQEKRELYEWVQGPNYPLDLREIYLHRVAFAAVITDNEAFLNKISVLSSSFMSLSDAQKTAYESQLLLAYYQLMGQYELDRIESRVYDLENRAAQIKECARLINLIRLSRIEPPQDQALLLQIASSEHYTHYLGLRLLVPALTAGMDRVAAGPGKSAHEFISFINERRLYWVWGGSSVGTILGLLPDYMADTSNAFYLLGWTGLVGGSLSWILYFIRAGIQWTGLLTHTVILSEEERALDLTFQERLSTQWGMRKYGILNDTIWGICNFACFFVLVGSGLLGNIGNGFTAALLLMDAILTVYRLYEEEKAHHENILRYQKEIYHLEVQLKWLKQWETSKKSDIEAIEISLQEVKSRMAIAIFHREYQKQVSALDLLYATCLLSAFLLICASVVFAPHLALIMAVVGTLLCFTFNLIYSAAVMQVNVNKANTLLDHTNTEISHKINHFVRLFEQGKKESELKLLYLNLLDLKAESNYQQKMVFQQRYQMITSTIRDVIIPPLFITSLVFMPLGVGLPLLIVSLVLAVGIYWFTNDEPSKKSTAKVFPELAFQDFCKKAKNLSLAELSRLLDPSESEVATSISSLKLVPPTGG